VGGSGYPNGLKGEEISIEGRICAIAECAGCTDDLSARTKEAWSLEESLAYIQDKLWISYFDPKPHTT